MPYLLLLLLMLTGVGCYPVTRLQTPRTMPAGKVQFAGAVSAAPSRKSDLELAPDLAFRMGITDSTDVGVRVRLAAVEVSVKQQLLRDDVEVSIAPAFLLAELRDYDSIFDETSDAATSATVRAFRASVYVGSNADHEFSGWIAPTIDLGGRTLAHSNTGEELMVVPGLLGGIAVATTRDTRFILELGVLVPVTGTGDIRDDNNERVQTVLGPGDIRLECSIGFSVGELSRPAPRDPAGYPSRAAPVAD